MKRIVILACFVLILGNIFGQQSQSVLTYKELGFSIIPLEDKNTLGVVLYSFLPPIKGFAANLNIVIQLYEGSMKEYAKLSEEQIINMGWKLIESKIVNESEYRLEYSGMQENLNFHWLARIIRKGNKYFVITCTSLEDQYKQYVKKFETSLDSFKLIL